MSWLIPRWILLCTTVLLFKAQDGNSLQNGTTSATVTPTTTAATKGPPPLDVTIPTRGTHWLRLSWEPKQRLRNGKIQVCSSTKSADASPMCKEYSVKHLRSHYDLRSLQPSTKYFVTVAAGTGTGFGVKSAEISGITNGVPVTPEVISHSTLRINMKPAKYIKEVMVIVQMATSISESSKDIETKSLKPYHANTRDAYVTAYLKTDKLPLDFVIGDGKEYNFKNVMYVNHALKPDSSYIVFLRFFESEDSFFSTEWSQSVKTNADRPGGPPLDVAITSRGVRKLRLSWKPPQQHFRNGKILHYQVCRSTKSADTSPICADSVKLNSDDYYDLPRNLHPATKYFVTVAAGTSAGYGVKSAEISGITNGERVDPVAISYSTLRLRIEKPARYIKEVMVVVQVASSKEGRSKDIKTNQLQPYEANTQKPYITAYLKYGQLPVNFVIGNDEEYHSQEGKLYVNQHLKPASSYVVFLRFFESENSFYSTKWSQSVKTKPEAPPSGPPLDVAITSWGARWLRLSWKPPEEDQRNGRILHYQVCRSTSRTDTSPRCINSVTLSRGYYYLGNLRPATKYHVTVAAGTRPGYGVKSAEISGTTNEAPPSGPPLNVAITYRGLRRLRLSWKPPEEDQRNGRILHYQVCRYTSRADTSPTCINSVTLSRGDYDLRNLRPETKYYVTVAAGTSGGYGVKSAEISGMTTAARPSGPPLNVDITSRGKTWLQLSWKSPEEDLRNGKIRHYQVCNSTKREDTSPTCVNSVRLAYYVRRKGYYDLQNLQPSTKYFVTVAAATSAGYGVKSAEISKVTNGEPVNPVVTSYSTLRIDIKKPAKYIKQVIVIVQVATPYPRRIESIVTSELKSYQSTNAQNPYVTAYLKVYELPLSFLIGDGKEYNSDEIKYVNQPLKQNSSYVVFLRFFESQDLFYSTEWSESVKTMVKPKAPINLKVACTGLNKYNASWSHPPTLQHHQIRMYYVHYGTTGEATINLNVSKKQTSVEVHVKSDQKYMIQVRLETKAGKSDNTSTTWWTKPEPLTVTKTKDGYTVKLKRPKEEQNITTVALVLQQLQLNSSTPDQSEDIQLERQPTANVTDNDAFFVKEFDIADFEENFIEISLRESNNSRRRRRSAVEAFALELNRKYRIAQVNWINSEKAIWSYWSEPFTFSKGGADGFQDKRTGVAVGASFGAIIIVAALVLAVIFFIRRRRRYSDKETDENLNAEMKPLDAIGKDCIYSNESQNADDRAHPPVPVEEFAHYLNEMKENDYDAFQKEYDDLPKNLDTCWEVAKKPFNKMKNRYANIVTYDHSRVVLSGNEEEDYINATYIDGIGLNSYIATQGPKNNTVDELWRMVWEQRCYSIVMVTSLMELGKPKCEKYWPDSGTEMYGDVEVTLVKTEEFAYYVTHTLRIKKDGEEREVGHYYYSSWPDHGVPKYPTQLLAFRRHFRTAHLKQSGPVVVHCSAGVGRTGVFLAIDTTLEKLEKGLINSIDVFGEVCAMRERRMNMVQTLEQYIFVHDAILETILCGMNEVDSTKLSGEFERLAKVRDSGMTGFQEKFKRLGEISPKLPPTECFAGQLEGNASKNRNKNVYPAEFHRVLLEYDEEVENSDYINAVFVHGYLGRNYFIATQSPLPNTIHDFWRMVHCQKSSTVVVLNIVKEGTGFPKFWPNARGKPTQYGTMTVQLDSESEKDGIWTRKLILSPYPDLHDGQAVNIFHYTKWPDHRVPTNADGVIQLTSLVEKSRQSGQGPVIVTCSDGAGRTGTYIAISNLLERMKIEQTVDVFQEIKIIRGIRPQFVETAKQYQFCYSALLAYLDAFSDYANFE